jgi:hypothetical protein
MKTFLITVGIISVRKDIVTASDLSKCVEGCLLEPTGPGVLSTTVLWPVKLFVQCLLRCYSFLAGRLLL